MYKFLKFFTVFIIIFSFILTISSTMSFATSSNTNDDLPKEDYLSSSGVSSVQRVSSIPEANLGLNNILNIILIAIGVLLILFAIAILIRLKQ